MDGIKRPDAFWHLHTFVCRSVSEGNQNTYLFYLFNLSHNKSSLGLPDDDGARTGCAVNLIHRAIRNTKRSISHSFKLCRSRGPQMGISIEFTSQRNCICEALVRFIWILPQFDPLCIELAFRYPLAVGDILSVAVLLLLQGRGQPSGMKVEKSVFVFDIVYYKLI